MPDRIEIKQEREGKEDDALKARIPEKGHKAKLRKERCHDSGGNDHAALTYDPVNKKEAVEAIFQIARNNLL
jgi:hypothetical protein